MSKHASLQNINKLTRPKIIVKKRRYNKWVGKSIIWCIQLRCMITKEKSYPIILTSQNELKRQENKQLNLQIIRHPHGLIKHILGNTLSTFRGWLDRMLN